MKPMIAPTLEMATPRVRRYAEKLADKFGVSVTLHEFYECSPPWTDVENYQGERWVEGNWGAKFTGVHQVLLGDLLDLIRNCGKAIQIGDLSIEPGLDRTLNISVHLCGRLAR